MTRYLLGIFLFLQATAPARPAPTIEDRLSLEVNLCQNENVSLKNTVLTLQAENRDLQKQIQDLKKQLADPKKPE